MSIFDFNKQDGYSALMTAAYYNHILVFEALLVAGADFNEVVEVSTTFAILIPDRQLQNLINLTSIFTAK